MRRTIVVALTAVALLGMVAPGVYAQAPAAPAAPTPTFRITGFVDELMTYSNNTSNVDGDLHRKDYTFYGRTRGRFDIIGEYGKAKAVLGLELDLGYGQTGTAESNTGFTNASGSLASSAPGGSAVYAPFGTDGSMGLNTDVRGILEIKWLYTEFEVPYMPWPTVARLGGQPFGSAATYKLATYAASDFSGVNLTTTVTPNVKLVETFVAVQEMMAGRQMATGNAGVIGPTGVPTTNAVNPFLGVNPFQARGDDWAIIIAPEVTPIKGLDIKPMYSYFTAAGTTDGNARQGRGGISASNWFQNTCSATSDPGCSGNNASGTWRKGINEDRHTVGIDAQYRSGPFYLSPTVMYQFGNRSMIAPTAASGSFPGLQGNPVYGGFYDAGVVPGRKYTANLDAWFIDIRGGYQLGPLLLEGMGMYTTGNKARETTLRTYRSYQPLTTDTSYLADWGGQLTALGVDYLDAMMEAGVNVAYPGVAIGWDKYGRIQLGARATYAWTPALSMYGGWNGHWVPNPIQRNAVPLAGAGLLPIWTGQAANSKSSYIGNEIFAGLDWRFAPGLALSLAGGYMWTGDALDAITQPTQGARDARNVYILTSRVRFSF